MLISYWNANIFTTLPFLAKKLCKVCKIHGSGSYISGHDCPMWQQETILNSTFQKNVSVSANTGNLVKSIINIKNYILHNKTHLNKKHYVSYTYIQYIQSIYRFAWCGTVMPSLALCHSRLYSIPGSSSHLSLQRVGRLSLSDCKCEWLYVYMWAWNKLATDSGWTRSQLG